MTRIASLAVGCLVARTALADEPVRVTSTTDVHLAFATNTPLLWQHANSIAGALFVGVGDHDSIRINVASWNNTAPASGLIAALFHADEEASLAGRTTDIGIAWQYFPRRTWDGFVVEIGGLYRTSNVSARDESAPVYYDATDTQVIAARAMLGWSWLIRDRVMITAAAGASLGYERGTETTQPTDRAMQMTRDVSRIGLSAEGYLRIGVAFDLTLSSTVVQPPR